MKGIRFYLFSVLALAGSILNAQEQTYPLTLQEARDYAIQHNKTLLNAKDKVTVAKKQVMETVAQGLPQVEGSLDYLTYFNYELMLDFGSSGGGQPDIDYSLLDAGDYEVLDAITQMFGSSEPIIMDDQFSGKVQVSQLIFSGQYYSGIQLAKIGRKLADQSLVMTELDVKETVTNTYYNILAMDQNLQLVKTTIKKMEEIQQHTINMFKAGMAEETDVDRISVSVNNLKNTQKSLERMSEISYNMMKFQLGVTPETKIQLTDSLNYFIEPLKNSMMVSDSFDIQNNINYKLMESQVDMSKKQVNLQYWAYTPSVVGFYSYTEKFKTTGFDMTPNHLAGITVSVPILSSGMKNSQLAQSKINLDIAQRNQEMVKEQLETQNNQLHFNFQNALENYSTQMQNLDVAARVFAKINNKYRQGMASSFELIQENNNYIQAETNYLNAVVTLLQAKTALDKLNSKL